MDPALIHGPSFYRFYIPFLLLRTVSKTVDDTYTIHWGKRYCMDLYIESLYGSYEMQPVRKVVMHQSILALPIPPPRANPGHLHSFFARGPGIGTCKVVPGAGNCLPAGHLTLLDVSAMNTCYYR